MIRFDEGKRKIVLTEKGQQEVDETLDALRDASVYSIPFSLIAETYRQALVKWGEHTLALAAVYRLAHKQEGGMRG